MNKLGLSSLVVVAGTVIGLGYWINKITAPEPVSTETQPGSIVVDEHENSVKPVDLNPASIRPESIEHEDRSSELEKIEFLREPDHGTADFLEARELALEKLPDGRVKSLRHRVVKTDFELIDKLLKTSLNGSEVAVGPHDLSFFADFPCSVVSVSGKELVPGTWSIKGKCSEHPGSILRISVWPYKEEFAVEFSGREKNFLIVNLIHDHSAVIELDTKTFPINND